MILLRLSYSFKMTIQKAPVRICSIVLVVLVLVDFQAVDIDVLAVRGVYVCTFRFAPECGNARRSTRTIADADHLRHGYIVLSACTQSITCSAAQIGQA